MRQSDYRADYRCRRDNDCCNGKKLAAESNPNKMK